MIAQMVEEIKITRKVLLVTHHTPDGDALGSSLGLMHLLFNQGKEVIVYSAEPVSANYNFLPGLRYLKTELPAVTWPDLVILLDCHESERVGEIASKFLFSVKRIAVIDHHLGQTNFGQVVWIDSSYSATCEMLGIMAQKANWFIDQQAAICFFLGIQTDTGRFSYVNTQARTFRLVADLIELGANPWAISQKVYSSNLPRLKLIGRIFSNFKLLAEGRLLLAQVSQADLIELGGVLRDLDRVIEELNTIKDVEVIVLLKEQKNGWVKASLRSRGGLDVGTLAISLGGGGHSNASGVLFKMNLIETESYIRRLISDKLGVI